MRLDSLHIKNYKLFKDLEIPKLGQVNLITGKNNTGKTILLEALRIWASEGDASVINNIIWKRGDWEKGADIKSYSSLFFNHEISPIYGPSNSYLAKLKGQIIINNIDIVAKEGVGKSLIFTTGKKKPHFDEMELVNDLQSHIENQENPQDKAIYVPASIDFNNKSLWKDIVFNRKRKDIVKVLKTIDDRISDIEIVDNRAFIGLENISSLVPLKNFGEGLNRLLTIAMALVSAEDNLLLIDEIDTGLHYSVLEKLWEIIFEFSGQLNTQVFVTTHSGDCVEAFTEVANKKEFEGMGNYFRLQWTRDNQKIMPILYKQKDLEIAVEQDIETR